MKIVFKRHIILLTFFTVIILFSQAASSDLLRVAHEKGSVISDGTNNMYAQNTLPNLRFGSINVHSRKGTYDIIAFKEYNYSVTLFAENSGVKNVRVIAGLIDGKVFYDKTFSYISAAAPKRIEFAYTMPIGTHTMYVEVDPANTVSELNKNDNRSTRTFIADLRIDVR